MAVQAIRNILVAASPVTALVGQRISPVERAQNTELPCVVLTRVSLAPTNSLATVPNLDSNRVQLDAYATTYAEARQVADACRAALETAGVTMEVEIDGFEPDVTEYRVTQDFLIWT